jgi:hypothetical protein
VSAQVGAGVLGLPAAKHHQSLRLSLSRDDLRNIGRQWGSCYSLIEGSRSSDADRTLAHKTYPAAALSALPHRPMLRQLALWAMAASTARGGAAVLSRVPSPSRYRASLSRFAACLERGYFKSAGSRVVLCVSRGWGCPGGGLPGGALAVVACEVSLLSLLAFGFPSSGPDLHWRRDQECQYGADYDEDDRAERSFAEELHCVGSVELRSADCVSAPYPPSFLREGLR